MRLHHPLSGVDIDVPDDAVVKALVAQRDLLAEGLRALATMVGDYFTSAHADGHGGVNEPDEADPICHVWNAAQAVAEDPGDISTYLYAEHGPADDDEHEKALIAAGLVLAALAATREPSS